MRRIALATGVELAVHEYGDGVPVVLLHAWGETHRVFDRLVPLLPATLQLVVPDLRGVGHSTKPTDGYSLRDGAADVIALLDSLGIETSWLIGTSSGGYLAQQVALDHPARVRGVVLIGSPSRLQLPPPAAFGELLSSPQPVTRADVDAVTAALPLHRPVPESFVEDQATAALTIPKHVWKASLEGLVGAVPPIDRGTITAPTLILWGDEEDVLPIGQAGELRAAIEDSQLVVYEGTGHLVLYEQPERVARDVSAFIEGRSGPDTSAVDEP
jgi:rifampin ADP-ribosylating transferase